MANNFCGQGIFVATKAPSLPIRTEIIAAFLNAAELLSHFHDTEHLGCLAKRTGVTSLFTSVAFTLSELSSLGDAKAQALWHEFRQQSSSQGTAPSTDYLTRLTHCLENSPVPYAKSLAPLISKTLA